MAGLQRSVVSFRRQGSSGLIWDDKFISEELIKAPQNDAESSTAAEELNTGRNIPPIKTVDRTRSNRAEARGFRSKDTAAATATAVEPPSPRISACGICSAFRNSGGKKQRTTAAGKRRSR
ncbi:MAPK kinase substrate protein At1g80180-like [Cucurbita pepo subsp. pepo]|uniref:MAPK kinase substrate protein At1g80180-like n=1 Tax=Cucurbita pepo subsp. pepo TaxID=3664 RepID=UPI000C9D27A3|nr:MAPK kinase substrate protein At1g80180-like [Cucurbita pepo subsp. pepo]